MGRAQVSAPVYTQTSYNLLQHTDNHHHLVLQSYARLPEGQVPTIVQNSTFPDAALLAKIETRLHVYTHPKINMIIQDSSISLSHIQKIYKNVNE